MDGNERESRDDARRTRDSVVSVVISSLSPLSPSNARRTPIGRVAEWSSRIRLVVFFFIFFFLVLFSYFRARKKRKRDYNWLLLAGKRHHYIGHPYEPAKRGARFFGNRVQLFLIAGGRRETEEKIFIVQRDLDRFWTPFPRQL